jgi:group I intron endonuclease
MLNRKSGIYLILNLVNGKFYIGSAFDFYERFHAHKSYLKNNSHHNSHLQRAYWKYGAENFIFIILEETENIAEREQWWIDAANATVNGYNIQLIVNSALGIKRSDETKAKMSTWQIGKTIDEEHRNKISETLTGRTLTESHRQNIAIGHRKIDKWPCIRGWRCKCDECQIKKSKASAIYRANALRKKLKNEIW